MNRQVPENKKNKPIAIIGNGKAAFHMMHYFALVGQPYLQWYRPSKSNSKATQLFSAKKKPTSRLTKYKDKIQSLFKASNALDSIVAKAQTVLLLIPDGQIESFVVENTVLKNKTLVHFSGALSSKYVMGCHPLMTFGAQLYSKDTYQNIPFVVDKGVDFKGLFPLLKNPIHNINPEDKALYHAYCVMAGNFSQMLWKNLQQGLEKINLPVDLMSHYLRQNTENFISDPNHSMTGPMVRGDLSTIAKHQQALLDHPLQGVYQSFVDLNRQTKQSEISQCNSREPSKRNQL